MDLSFDERKQLIIIIFAGISILYGLITTNVSFVGLGFVVSALILLLPKENFRLKFWIFEIDVVNKKETSELKVDEKKEKFLRLKEELEKIKKQKPDSRNFKVLDKETRAFLKKLKRPDLEKDWSDSFFEYFFLNTGKSQQQKYDAIITKAEDFFEYLEKYVLPKN